MKNLNAKLFIWIFAGLTLLFVVLAKWLYGVPKDADWLLFKFLSTVVAADYATWLLFSKWAWKWRVWKGWLVPYPNLNGTWKGVIRSNWINPQTGQRIEAIPALLVIKQSFSRVTCRLVTAESSSESFAESFELEPESGAKLLVYSYRNEPRPSVKERSEPHEGTVKLRVGEDKKRRLDGKYWNDRSKPVSGEMEFAFWKAEQVTTLSREFLEHPMRGLCHRQE
ncbi:MAG TPA: hypothetical protein VIS71_08250 [Terrimicrobium sp.]